MKKNPKLRYVDNRVEHYYEKLDCWLIVLNLQPIGAHVVGSSNPMWFNFYGYKNLHGDGKAGRIIGD